jgi:hypothetical protein
MIVIYIMLPIKDKAIRKEERGGHIRASEYKWFCFNRIALQ